jgi:hypothetical protein
LHCTLHRACTHFGCSLDVGHLRAFALTCAPWFTCVSAILMAGDRIILSWSAQRSSKWTDDEFELQVALHEIAKPCFPSTLRQTGLRGPRALYRMCAHGLCVRAGAATMSNFTDVNTRRSPSARAREATMIIVSIVTRRGYPSIGASTLASCREAGERQGGHRQRGGGKCVLGGPLQGPSAYV